MAASVPTPDPLDVAAEATRGLQGLSTELTARVPRLLEAMRSIGTGLELRVVLDRIAETAAELAGARCAAIGVNDAAGQGLADVITYGVTEADRERCGALVSARSAGAGLLSADPLPRSFLGVPIRVGDEVFGHLCLAEKRDGGEFSVPDLHVVKVLATEAGIAIGNARLHEATRQRERWIDGSVAVTHSLLSGDAEDALVVVAEKARQLAGSAAGFVLVPEEGGGLEIVAVDAAHPPEGAALLGTVVPAGSPAVPRLLAGEPVFVDDPAAEPRLTAGVLGRYGPSMMLPLSGGDRVLGVLATPRAPGARPFTATERRLALQFAAQAAVALVLAEAQRDRERLAVLEERDRIARDLHDLVIQRLFATGMLLESALRHAEAPEVAEQVERAADELGATIREIRTTIFALQQGPEVAPSGLRTRVLREVGAAAVPLGFQPSLSFIGPVDSRVGEPAGNSLIAALREALSNAFRHARAARIEVVVDVTARLDDGRPAVRLTVADDGVGVPAGGRRSGLANLARRAEALGGSSTYGPGLGAEDGVENGPGEEPGRGGTTVVWQVPL
ncbi:GAF domain-containing sensor histidine kinase [Streptomyces sp. Rer75]|uniref:GAF domain-containing sensor histidine kinase n=1 Tax=Streptomyces sp. Rer75 TaxID=2750011 RepID=UPI0015D01CA6|nr:GAF domain-containing protein [Streptomyces sp. Rer75]QLH22886.1 GAF domain-containing protein [Streptomyces sp. Rer75]